MCVVFVSQQWGTHLTSKLDDLGDRLLVLILITFESVWELRKRVWVAIWVSCFVLQTAPTMPSSVIFELIFSFSLESAPCWACTDSSRDISTWWKILTQKQMKTKTIYGGDRINSFRNQYIFMYIAKCDESTRRDISSNCVSCLLCSLFVRDTKTFRYESEWGEKRGSIHSSLRRNDQSKLLATFDYQLSVKAASAGITGLSLISLVSLIHS